MRTPLACLLVVTTVVTGRAAAQDPPPDTSAPAPARSKLGRLLALQGYTAVPLIQTVDYGLYLVRVEVDGRPFTLVLDTGSSGEVALTVEAGKKLGDIPLDSEFDGRANNNPSITSVSRRYGVGAFSTLSFPGTRYRVRYRGQVRVVEGLKLEVAVEDPKTGRAEPVAVDGLLGQRVLVPQSAVIDHDTATLYVIPLHDKELPRLAGRWEGVGGQRDGKPLADPGANVLDIGADWGAEATLDGRTVTGYVGLDRVAGRRLICVRRDRPKGRDPEMLLNGIYQADGDRLKLCLIDGPLDRPRAGRGLPPIPPTRFEAPAGSEHVLYEFQRKPADPLK